MNNKFAKLVRIATAAAIVGSLVQPLSWLPSAHAADAGRISLEVNKTLTAPVIDGKLDESIWKIDQPLNKKSGQGTFKDASFGLLWDNQYLYVGVKADDDTLTSNATGYWFEQDNINIFLDPTKHQSAPFAADDMQIGLVYQPGTATPEFHFGAAPNNQGSKDEKKILRSISKTSTGWAMEMAVPWNMLNFDPVLTKQLGINIGATDRYGADSSEQRSSFWSAYNEDTFWNNTAGYGVITLSDSHPVSGNVNPVLLNENFDSYPTGSTPDGWVSDVNSGSSPFTVVQDTYGNGRLTFDGNASGKQSRIIAPVQWDNYAIEADVKFDAFLNTGRWASIMFRAPSTGKTPYPQMAIKQNGTIETAYRKPDGSWYSPTPISGTGATLQTGKDYTMKLRVFDNNVKQYLKMKSDADFTGYGDKNLTSEVLPEKGRVGFQGDQSKVSFDNLKVTRITADRLDMTVSASLEALTGPASVTHSVYFSDGITDSVPADRVKLYSSDDSVIKIINNQIYPVKEGTAKIKAVYYNAETEKTITVTRSTTGVQLTSLKHDTGYVLAVSGQTVDLSAITFQGSYNDFSTAVLRGDQLNWSSSSNAVVIENGQLKSVSQKGVYTVTVQKDGGSIALTVVVKDPADKEYVLYEQNFDSLPDGSLPPDWTRIEGTTAAAAVVKSGAFELDARTSPDNPSRVLLPSYLGAFGNYKIEADVTHLAANDSARWHSIMYRIQNNNYPYYQMAVRQNASANGVEFAERTSSNGWNVMEKASYSESIQADKMYHYTVIALGNRVQQWINDQMIVDTEAATAYAKGRIGFQSNGSKMKVDNIRVTLQESALPPTPTEKFVKMATPDTKIALVPSVAAEIHSLDDLSALSTSSKPAAVMLHVTGDLQVTDQTGQTNIGGLDTVMGIIGTSMIPTFYVKDEQAVDQLVQYLKAQAIEDAFVVSDRGELVKRAREAYPILRGIIDFTARSVTKDNLLDIRRETSANNARIAILPQAAAVSRDMVEYLQQRAIMVWGQEASVQAERTLVMHKLITAGVDGIMTGAPQTAVDAFKLYSHNTTLIRKPFILAHRGLPSQAPEDTIESNILGLDAGGDFIENDMWLSKDGHIVIVHDDTLDRTTNGTGSVENFTLEQLKALNANKPHPAGFPNVKIPTWDEQIDLAQSKGKMVESEIKSSKPEMVNTVIQVIKDKKAEDTVNMMSFNTEQLMRLRQQMPEMPTGLLVNGITSNETNVNKSLRDAIRNVQGTNATFNVGYYNIGKNFMESAHHHGLIVSPWTINNQNDFISMFMLGPWGITTDYADYASDWAASIQPEKDQYDLAQNDSLTLSASVVSFKGAKTAVTPEIVLLDGQDVVNVDGAKMTAKNAGTVHALLRTTQVIDTNNQYDMYSQPITIEVKGGHKGHNSGSGSGGGVTPTVPATPNEGSVNGSDASKSIPDTVEATDGKADASKLKESLGAHTRVQVKFTGDTVTLPAAGVSSASGTDGKTLLLTGDHIAYTLPLSALKLDALAQKLGVSVNDVTLRFTAKKLEESEAAAVSGAVAAAGGKLAAAPVKFIAEATGKDGAAVPAGLAAAEGSRELTLDRAMDPSKATGVKYDPQTKQLQFVPALFTVKDGQTIVTLKGSGDGVFTIIENNKSFADLANHWAQADIELLANKLIVDGAAENRFDPDRHMTRAEFAALLVRALGLESASGKASFSDVKAADWYAAPVAAAASAGLLGGYEDGSFRPNKGITREEQAAMMVRAMAYAGIDAGVSPAKQDEALAAFKDAKQIVWAKAEVAAALQAGLLNGMTTDTLDSASYATRAQSAVMLKRLLSKVNYIN
ncbi:glycerophosphodiester phosphodiesterase family protein [Paenibacillus rigui]|uniref:Glycerophosphoryl diester phosphodiesterase n=1 Tax=Paenibacillus rigui TaxID=554312 RepID=A0A229UR43_9BACL|nr:glycerophosphodiester phosphodiesterase family protein [Paenibacillus rigui]OXM85721.1 hypothetical protein CF651_14000 [Paenibacillus rigui]